MSKRYATSRQNEIASLLESFIDENENILSPMVFDLLDSLADEIDALERSKNFDVKELENRIEELENEVTGLENQLEELEQ